MIKQDFYIANIIARHLSGEITHKRAFNWRVGERKILPTKPSSRKYAVKRILKNMWRKVCHLMSQPAGWKYKSVLGKAITGNG